MAPVIWMLASTVIYGLYPLVAYSASAIAHPILLIALAHSAATLVQFVALIVAARREGKALKDVFVSISPFGKIFKWAAGQGVVHSVAHISLFAAFIYLDKYAAALIYDAWPILMIVMAAPLLPGRALPTAKEWFFILLSFVGLILILSAKAGGADGWLAIGPGPDSMAGFGAAIALLSMVGMAFTAVAAVRLEALSMAAYRFLAMRSEGERARAFKVSGNEAKPYSSAILSPFLGNAFSMIVSIAAAVIYFALSDDVAVRADTLDPVLGLGLAAGVIAATAQICFIISNRSTRLTSINVLYNLTPLFGILFLYLAGTNETIEGQILLGGMLVIAANLAISVHAEITIAYYVSIASICIVSVYCFFVPGMDINAYYSAIAIPAGIFAILIAFMTERLSVRQLRQEDIAIEIFESYRKRELHGESRERLREVVSNVLISNSAKAVRDSARAFINRNRESSPEVSSLMARLATNRLRIFGFGEIFVLWLIGVATLGLAVFGRPPNVEANMLATVLAATISFLCVLVIEPVNSQRASMLFGLLGEMPGSRNKEAGARHRDIDFLVMACTSALFAGILFFLFFVAIAQQLN